MKSSTLIIIFFACLLAGQAQDSSLTAQEAVDIALQNNLSIQIAKSDLDISRINNNWGNSGRWPIVTAGFGNNESLVNLDQKLSNGTEIVRNGTTHNTTNANLT